MILLKSWTRPDRDPCSAPLKSSHLGYLLGAVLDRASIPQRLMRSFLVVPRDPVPNDPPRLLKGLERVLPDALLFQTPKKPFDHPILLRRVRRDEPLLQAIVATVPVETADSGRSGRYRFAARGLRSDAASRTGPGRPLRRLAPPPSLDFGVRTRSRSLRDHDSRLPPPNAPTHRAHREYASHPSPTVRYSDSLDSSSPAPAGVE